MENQLLQTEEMKVLEYDFYHQGCCDTELTDKFPDIHLSDQILQSSERNGRVYELDRAIITARDKYLLEKALAFRRSQDQIIKVLVLNRTERSAEILSWCIKPINISFKYILPKNMAMSIGQVIEENGNAAGRVMCPAKNFKGFIEDLEARGILKIRSVTKFDPREEELTQCEKIAMKTAIKFGYYSWPRKITLEELGEKVGLSRRGFQDNLRRAETKVMNAWE